MTFHAALAALGLALAAFVASRPGRPARGRRLGPPDGRRPGRWRRLPEDHQRPRPTAWSPPAPRWRRPSSCTPCRCTGDVMQMRRGGGHRDAGRQDRGAQARRPARHVHRPDADAGQRRQLPADAALREGRRGEGRREGQDQGPAPAMSMHKH
ncbi:MAG: hypothetical protein MZW92_27880 [Comamonadaceae bacterium]|nr:hypothetical protein [Comamonadaceae bacterium]